MNDSLPAASLLVPRQSYYYLYIENLQTRRKDLAEPGIGITRTVAA